MTLRDVVGWLVGGFRKKGAVRLGLFLLGPPDYIHNNVSCIILYMYHVYRLSNRPALEEIVPYPALTLIGTPFVPLSNKFF